MKIKLLISFSIVITISIQAQNWCPPGAIWSYTMGPAITPTQPRSGMINDVYKSDTIINGKVCKHIVGVFKGRVNPDSPLLIYNKYRESYTYENNKVIYVWLYSALSNVNTFDTVVNFNAAIGDKWLKNRWGGTCNSRRPVMVKDTGHVTISGQSLKRVVTSYTSAYTSGIYTYTSQIIDTLFEKIMNRSRFMIPQYCELDNVFDFEIFNGNFLCYNDSLFSNYQRPGTTNCGYIINGLQEKGGVLFQGRIYPNPASGQLLIESEILNQNEVYSIVLTDLLGQCAATMELKSLNNRLFLDLTAVNQGIYCLQLRDRKGILANQKIIKEQN